MSLPGIKHLIECHCYLAIYKNQKDYLNHKFPVYSKVDEYNQIIPRLAKCNNCDALHNIIDVGISEIVPGKDDIKNVLTIEDMCLMLPKELSNILNSNTTDISNYEHALDIIENKRWGEFLILKREIVNETEQIKVLTINNTNRFKISIEKINNIIKGD